MIHKKLDDKNILYKTTLFPSINQSKKTNMHHKALLGIGGNIGDVQRRFHHLYYYLQKSNFIEIIESSYILKNPPFGYDKQDDFFNALLYIKTPLLPFELLRYILRVEKIFRRKRLFANAPRTLDIDIIFYEDKIINHPTLTLPHPHWNERTSVLIPLLLMKNKI
ncbi:MAG: 2-amino-4-hydroxy-6-hydroxymethyldihydropteridine pyrophosphokinase [Sulfurovum sp. AS07-7]|nr:MAG: 2-amino-4-hydroxy-6-hydroxymethyldihydropteridine pyrophosphokinase [Sulfurovum sp. AS07-7]KIM05979.1 MAG: 2-amino-4-hydroxy-6-hydroxymethyldihydropteridine pyrophosphokinase [Sulfurovum sp. AS07-7]